MTKKNNNPINLPGMKRTLGKGCLSLSLLCTAMVATAKNQTIDDLTATTLNLGTPASFLSELQVNDLQHAKAGDKKFALLNNLGATINVEAEDFSLQSNGTVSMSGRVQGSKNSRFIMQGDDDHVYGWVILQDKNVAYEYTTENGQLVVNQIKVTDVHPI